MTMRWFGIAWPSGVCDEHPQVPAPVGAPCSWCDEPIAATDTGGVIYSNGPVAHRECFIRQIIGSVAHIQGQCGCYRYGSALGFRESERERSRVK